MGEADRIISEYARREVEIPDDRYSPTSRAELYMTQSKERAAVLLLERSGALPLPGRRALEVGCGTAPWLATFESWGARQSDLAGIDLLPEPVERARARLVGADLRVGDATALPWDDGAFDIVVQSTVFTSILDGGMRHAVAGEMARVLAPGGTLLWFDFFVNNPRNPNVSGVRRSELSRLFPGFELTTRRIILAPPLSRRIVRASWLVTEALEALRFLNTHYMAALRRRSP